MKPLHDLTTACGDSPTLFCRWVYDVTGKEPLAGLADWFVARPAKVLFIFLVALVANRLARRAIQRLVRRLTAARDAQQGPSRLPGLRSRARHKAALALQAERSKQRADSLGALLRSLSGVGIYTLAAIISLGEFGVSLGPLVAGAGIVGVALGFGAQALVRDFISGAFILIEDQFGVGDVVDLGDATGVVEAVNLRSTRLRDVHGTVWHIANGTVRRVGNKSQQWARAVIDVGVPYSVDLDKATVLIKEVLDSVWRDAIADATVLEEPEIWGVESFGDSSITIRAALKVEPGEQWATAREVRKRLKPAFDRAGIEFPFPQRTIWVNNVIGSAAPDLTPPEVPRLPSRGGATETAS